jgi:hypothetical protein
VIGGRVHGNLEFANGSMSDMMSDMKTTKTKATGKEAETPPDTFTVRDMSRNTASVLNASLVHGQVRIKSRGGPTFLLMPDRSAETLAERAKAAGDFASRQREYREKLRAMGARPPLPEDMERINSIIAGEE